MTKTRSYTKGPGVLGAALLLAVGVLGAVFAASPAGATLPGANGKIAYANGGIWGAGPGGENPTRLTSSIVDADPSWSPDGERLAYESCATSGFYPCDSDKRNVSLVNPDGTGRVDLTSGMRSSCDDNTTSRVVEPAWSPDGTRIAFASSAERCRMEIYAMDADGQGPPLRGGDQRGGRAAELVAGRTGDRLQPQLRHRVGRSPRRSASSAREKGILGAWL
jgi:Tol biopolymer transport system component